MVSLEFILSEAKNLERETPPGVGALAGGLGGCAPTYKNTSGRVGGANSNLMKNSIKL